MEPLKVSLVGCGGIGEVHARIIKQTASFLSCCDTDLSLAAEFGETFGVKHYGTLRELVNAEKPDVLHIATPHYTHVPLALYALRHGIHVFMEKPAAHCRAEMDALISESAKLPPQLAVCFQNRYSPFARKAKELIDSGAAGRPLGARAIVTWSRSGDYYTGSPWRGALNTEGTSILINQSIHTIDLLQYLLGAPIEVDGSTRNRGHKDICGTEDAAEALLTFEGGVKAAVYCTTNYVPGFDDTLLEIACENMCLTLRNQDLLIDGEPQPLEKLKLLGKPCWGGAHEVIIREFYEHISSGKRFPLDVISGSQALRTCFDILSSPILPR